MRQPHPQALLNLAKAAKLLVVVVVVVVVGGGGGMDALRIARPFSHKITTAIINKVGDADAMRSVGYPAPLRKHRCGPHHTCCPSDES